MIFRIFCYFRYSERLPEAFSNSNYCIVCPVHIASAMKIHHCFLNFHEIFIKNHLDLTSFDTIIHEEICIKVKNKIKEEKLKCLISSQ